jgi:uncharacterized protein YuzE
LRVRSSVFPNLEVRRFSNRGSRWENVFGEGRRGDGPGPACGGDGVPNQQGREVLETGMKVKYDPEVDVLSIVLSDAPVEESDEDKPGVILDYDKDGNVVGLEILDASRRMGNPMSVEYAIAR